MASSTALEAYHVEREALIAKEKSRRHDHEFRQRLSPTAKKACQIVSVIRKHEAETVWNKEEGAYSGMMWALAKERMEKTKLWKIVRRLPKGCLLHAHFDAMVDLDWLFEQGVNVKGMKIHSDVPLTSKENLDKASVAFVYNSESSAEEANIFDASYTPGTRVEFSHAADTFPQGGRAGFLGYLYERAVITPEVSMAHHEGLDAIWQKFQQSFQIFYGLWNYEPIFRKFTQRLFNQLVGDNISYVDFRIAFLPSSERNAGEIRDNAHMLTMFQDELAKFKASEAGKNFWGARIIWTTIRRFDRNMIEDNMKECVAIKKAFPELIAGFDLVGQENSGRPLQDLLPELLWFRNYCKEQDVDLPFFFHAGEVNSDGDVHDENLFDAILLGTKRIGHGFSLYKHPELMEIVRERKICLEVCPISNEVLRLASSILQHPLPAFLANGVPVALSNDDPGILGQGTAGMSHDFWQVLQGFQNVGLEGLGDLIETSVTYAAFYGEEVGVFSEGGEREKRMELLRAEWESFCAWIVEEFAEYAEKV